MSNPQIENGHTQIANEILEQLMRVHLSPNQWQIVLCIIRKTYGYHKKVDYIANSQICEATGLCKAVVSRSLTTLEAMKIILRQGKYIGFQKDWEKWRKLAKQSILGAKLAEQLTPKMLAIPSTELAESSTTVDRPAVAQKKKETIQKKEDSFKNYSPAFKEAFKDYKEMRVKIRKPMTDKAVLMVLKKLKELASSEVEQIAIINQSICNSWGGVFPLKDRGKLEKPIEGRQTTKADIDTFNAKVEEDRAREKEERHDR